MFQTTNQPLVLCGYTHSRPKLGKLDVHLHPSSNPVLRSERSTRALGASCWKTPKLMASDVHSVNSDNHWQHHPIYLKISDCFVHDGDVILDVNPFFFFSVCMGEMVRDGLVIVPIPCLCHFLGCAGINLEDVSVNTVAGCSSGDSFSGQLFSGWTACLSHIRENSTGTMCRALLCFPAVAQSESLEPEGQEWRRLSR